MRQESSTYSKAKGDRLSDETNAARRGILPYVVLNPLYARSHNCTVRFSSLTTQLLIGLNLLESPYLIDAPAGLSGLLGYEKINQSEFFQANSPTLNHSVLRPTIIMIFKLFMPFSPAAVFGVRDACFQFSSRHPSRRNPGGYYCP